MQIWYQESNPEGFASSRGPADRYRIKPDVVGANSGAATAHVSTTVSQPCEVLGVQDGTSAASAGMSGFVAMLRQYVREGRYPSGSECSPALNAMNPTNALLKALLINSTRNVPGLYTADDFSQTHQDRPTFGQGWGYPVLSDVLFFPGDPIGADPAERKYMLILTDSPNGMASTAGLSDSRSTTCVDMKPAIMNGEIHEFVVHARPGEDLHVTLAWSDFPAPGNEADPLLADLDLEVVGPNPSNPAQQVVWRPNPGVTSNVDANGANVDVARAWSGGYTVLGRALCGDPPPPEVFTYGDSAPDYENCPQRPTCPVGEPQYLFPQAAPFSCFNHRDPFNTVENVFLRASDVLDADYTIRVIGFSVPAAPFNLSDPPPVLPNYDSTGGPDFDLPDGRLQGYALVVSGDVSADRGFVHLNQAHYLTGDTLIVTVVDRDAPLAGRTVTLMTGATDSEAVVSDAFGRFPPMPVIEGPATPGNGIIEFPPSGGSKIEAAYDDLPAGPTTKACASTGSYITMIGPRVTPICGDPADLNPGEFASVEVEIRNDSIRSPVVIGTLEPPAGDTDILVPRSRVSFGVVTPAANPSNTFKAHFTIQVSASAICPSNHQMVLTLMADGQIVLVTTVPIDIFNCVPESSVVSVPGEVPNTSLRVTRNTPSTVLLTWDLVAGRDAYNVYRGSISSVSGTGRYDHHYRDLPSPTPDVGVCGVTTENATLPDAGTNTGNWYYLVTAVKNCGDPAPGVLEGTAGFASAQPPAPGTERPTGWGCP